MRSRKVDYPLAIAALLIISFGGTCSAFAQQAVSAATLSGRVEDPNGAAVRGARITITNIEKNQSTSSISDEHGRYSFLYLPVGSYHLKIELAGFDSLTRELPLSVGQALELPIRLSVAGLAESANITDSAP